MDGHREASERTPNTSVIQGETRKLGQRQWKWRQRRDKTRKSNVLGWWFQITELHGNELFHMVYLQGAHYVWSWANRGTCLKSPNWWRFFLEVIYGGRSCRRQQKWPTRKGQKHHNLGVQREMVLRMFWNSDWILTVCIPSPIFRHRSVISTRKKKVCLWGISSISCCPYNWDCRSTRESDHLNVKEGYSGVVKGLILN